MKFLTTTSQFLFSLLLCMSAHNIQVKTAVRVSRRKLPRNNTNRYKHVQKGGTSLTQTKKGAERPGSNKMVLGLALVIVSVLVGSSYLYAQKGENEENHLREEDQKPVERWTESIWEVQKVDQSSNDKEKLHSKNKIMTFIGKYLKEKATNWTSPKNPYSKHQFNIFVSEIYWEKNTYGQSGHLTGLQKEGVLKQKKLLYTT